MFRGINRFISSSLFRIKKVSVFLIFFGLGIFLLSNSNSLSEIKSSGVFGFFSGPSKISLLKSHLEESKWSTSLDELAMEGITPEEAEIFLFILRLSESITPTDAQKLAKLIVNECSKNDLDPYLILAVIQTESNFTPKAVSSRGAVGLMQVMPKTGEFIAKDLGISYKGHKSLYDPFVNVKLGIHYLSLLEEQFDGTENALAAYNYGPTKFANSRTLAKSLPQYVKKVLNFKNFLEQESILLAKSS